MVHSVKQKIINYSFSQTANDCLNIYRSNCENDHYYSRAIKIHKYTYEETRPFAFVRINYDAMHIDFNYS